MKWNAEKKAVKPGAHLRWNMEKHSNFDRWNVEKDLHERGVTPRKTGGMWRKISEQRV
jgi:hypothetical protein